MLKGSAGHRVDIKILNVCASYHATLNHGAKLAKAKGEVDRSII